MFAKSFVFSFVIAATLAAATTSETSVGQQLRALKQRQQEMGIEASFWHVAEIMHAISSKTVKFEVQEEVSYLDFLHSVQQGVADIPRNSSIAYTLRSDVSLLSLDSTSSQNSIQDISDDNIHYCHESSHPHPTVGDVFIASQHHSSNGRSSALNLHLKSPKILRNEGFRLIRSITKVQKVLSASQTPCYHFETEDLHPIELFEKFEINSQIDHAYETTYYPLSQTKTDELKTQSVLPPKYPMSECVLSDADWADYEFYAYYAYESPDYNFLSNYAMTWGCMDLSESLAGSFNFNYNYLTGSAIQPSLSIPGVSGVTCSNCFAFLGAQFDIHVEYTMTHGFRAQAVISGGAGANINLAVVNPSVSGSITATLLSPEEEFGTAVLSFKGLSLYVKFGGMDITVSGSGSAIGAAHMIAGNGASASEGFTYVDSKMGYISTVADLQVDPSFTYTSFRADSFSLGAQLDATINLQLALYSFISLDFDVLSSNYIEFAVGSVAASSLAFRSTTQGVLGVQEASKSHKSGDEICFDIEYSGFNPLEKTVLYFSLRNDEVSIPIFTNEFNTSLDGSGIETFCWIVPWDSKFVSRHSNGTIAGDNCLWTAEVHASNLIKKRVLSDSPFCLNLFDEMDGIFIAPSSDEVLTIRPAPFLVEWDWSLLTYFKVDNVFTGQGSLVTAERIRLFLATDIHANGTVKILLTNGTVSNTGKAEIVFDEVLLQKFPYEAIPVYLIVESAYVASVYGWSSGYFSLHKMTHLRKHETVQVISNPKHIPFAPQSYRFKNPNHDMMIQSCSGSFPAQLTMGSDLAFSLTSIDVGYRSLLSSPMEGSPMELVTPYSVCVASEPLPVPSSTPTRPPTRTPTRVPTRVPSRIPTVVPSRAPTKPPTSLPSATPTRIPSLLPTPIPSQSPSRSPTLVPSKNPTQVPTAAPSVRPSMTPSLSPTFIPSSIPSAVPTFAPTSRSPTLVPSFDPSAIPSAVPSAVPSTVPSAVPSTVPTPKASAIPSATPSAIASAAPSEMPSGLSSEPSKVPTNVPSRTPTSRAPTQVPSFDPSVTPSAVPTAAAVPSMVPSPAPSPKSSVIPSAAPTVAPFEMTSLLPSAVPSPVQVPPSEQTSEPTALSTATPSTLLPTAMPIKKQGKTPTKRPSKRPTNKPSKRPSPKPSSKRPKPPV